MAISGVIFKGVMGSDEKHIGVEKIDPKLSAVVIGVDFSATNLVVARQAKFQSDSRVWADPCVIVFAASAQL